MQETEKYINGLDDNNNHCNGNLDDEAIGDKEELQLTPDPLQTDPTDLDKKISLKDNLKQKLNPKGILKRVQSRLDSKPPTKPDNSLSDVKKPKFCHPIVDKLKLLAERHLKRKSKPNTMDEKQEILKLRESPKAGGREIGAYIERHESDDFVEIVNLEESPSETRRIRELEKLKVPKADEIIELPKVKEEDLAMSSQDEKDFVEPTVAELLEEEMKNDVPPKKSARRQKEHVYEDIDENDDPNEHLNFTLMTPETVHLHPRVIPEIDLSIIGVTGESLKTSLRAQDDLLTNEIEDKEKRLSELFNQSSEEEEPQKSHLLAPISSIDSASSEEDRKMNLPAVAEESDQESNRQESVDKIDEIDLKTSLKIEASSSPSLDKKVTFSPSTEDDPDLRKEDVETTQVPTTTVIATKAVSDRWKGMR